jgi:hypothetical protein
LLRPEAFDVDWRESSVPVSPFDKSFSESDMPGLNAE